ncbi:SulP family inorganic anion transporter [Motiliproteus coralliicola]|uniref:SulP family inorganic anion transporter n=1 Tax=Motiliproteus coralliicola TaxID=2283196 RepID=A0A369WQC0_9GAMM|nr:SulP family inorganic anion transporter [Motiliproteus coralliicola]RDE24288.1 SulP family inorganic anion transporter [Motiliproteus coralliicola]
MAWFHGLHFNNLRGDLFGGITAAVVALPLALAFGVSSGAGAIAGLYGAIFVGLFAALFGGTSAQVSGPTGPMTVVMATVYTQLIAADPQAGPAMAFTVVMLSGLFQILFGLMRLGRYVTLVPFPVISGFMTGIGLIIILLQLGPLLGFAAGADVLLAFKALPTQLATLDPASLSLGVMALVILFFWPSTLALWLPAPLAALILGTLMALWGFADSDLAVIGAIPTGMPGWHLPSFSAEHLQLMLTSALMLAALGAIDSLLTSLVADNMLKTQHRSNRELIGQGLGNLVSGLFGGLPGAGATMRTVVNVRAGGRTPLSGAVHALLLLAVVLGAGPLAEKIPLAVLAGILIKVGLDIIDWNFLRRAYLAPPFVLFLMVLVLLLTVFVDLIVAVGTGVFLANLYTVKRLSDLQLGELRLVQADDAGLDQIERRMLQHCGDRLAIYRINGPISFGAAKGIHARLRSDQGHEALVLDLHGVSYIDVSTALTLEEIILEIKAGQRLIYLVGMKPDVEQVLKRMRVLQHLRTDQVCEDREQALGRACRVLAVDVAVGGDPASDSDGMAIAAAETTAARFKERPPS